MTGQTISHYRILQKLGGGGMGVVYQAEDTRLKRHAALKFLPPDLCRDPIAIERFRREAQAASALNHPNICTIYDIGEHEGEHYIVMELLEGQTFKQRLEQGPLPKDQLLDLATEIADALDAAHAEGIVHRDIKPGNLFLTRRGHAKILDFGLAKLAPAAAGPDLPTITAREALSRPGTVMGTAAYMSPEQARAEEIDARSDLFSFGAVLYEMATGRMAFTGTSNPVVFEAILNRTPEVPAGLDPELARILSKALEKDRALRHQTAAELRTDFKRLSRPVAPSPQSPPRPRRPLALVAAGAAITAALAWYLLARRGEAPSLQNATFTQLTDQAGPELYPSLSPDGKSFLYQSRASGNWDIYLQRVGGKNPVNLTKDSPLDDTQPAFSPDAERIAFRSERDGGGIFVMGATGESAKRLTDFGFHPSWSPDGTAIVCATMNFVEPTSRGASSRLFRVNLATGERLAVTPESEDAVQPQWSPGGRRIAFWSQRGGQRDISTVAASGGQPVAVTSDAALDWSPAWSPDGRYLYFASDRGGSMNLWRVRMEEASGKALGPPEPLTTPSPYSGHVTLARGSRHLAYMHRSLTANLYKVSVDPARGAVMGQPVAVTQGSRLACCPNVSPDGQRLAFWFWGKQEDLAVVRTDGTGLRTLTDDLHRDRAPRWSPDGKRLLFYSNRSGKYEAWTIQPDGSGLRQLTFESRGNVVESLWSPDGARLVYLVQGHGTYLLDAAKPWRDQTPQELPPLGESSAVFLASSWSADGEKLAGHRLGADFLRGGISIFSFRSRRFERLTEFGVYPVWLHDQRRLLFQSEGKIYLLDSLTGTTREFLSIPPNEAGPNFDISPDDRTLYFVLHANEADVWLMSLP